MSIVLPQNTPLRRSSKEGATMTDGEKKAYVRGYVAALALVRKGLEIQPMVDRRRALNVVDAIERGLDRAAQKAKELADAKE